MIDIIEDEKIFTIDQMPDCKRLDQWLASSIPDATRARIQSWISSGFLTFADGSEIKKLSATPLLGMKFRLNLPPPIPAEPLPENIQLDIIFEDSDIIVINKPADLVVHPACGHETGTLVNALLFHCHNLQGIGGVKRPGIVHRLDKDTSGIIIVAKNEIAMNELAKTFHDHVAMTKIYTAIVHGAPKYHEGIIDTLIGRHPVHRQEMAIVKKNGKQAITKYVVETNLQQNLSRVKCIIETGRTHQIRVHLASLGTPIVGDQIYGKSSADKKLQITPTRQLLHARQLIIPHPITKKILDFTAPYPEDFLPYV